MFRSAVAHQYNDSLAVGRLRAAFAGRYSFEESADSRGECSPLILVTLLLVVIIILVILVILVFPIIFISPLFSVLGSGLSTKMDVSFPLKPESTRSAVHVETVDLLSQELLRAILLSCLEEKDPAAREFLKPVNMSKASPRIFWSLIKAYGGDIPSAMRQLFPQVSCYLIVDGAIMITIVITIIIVTVIISITIIITITTIIIITIVIIIVITTIIIIIITIIITTIITTAITITLLLLSGD